MFALDGKFPSLLLRSLRAMRNTRNASWRFLSPPHESLHHADRWAQNKH